MPRNIYINRSGKNKNKKSKRKKIFMWVFFPILIIGLSALVYGGFLYKKAESVVNNSYKPVNVSSKRTEKANPKIDNISILLIGIDESKKREKEYGDAVRTDALMVATLNEKDKSIKLVSIPRDSYVKIPGRKNKTKINHAHAYGGTELTIETVQELLDIPIDYYVKMNFHAFIDVVDALDGINVEVPYELYEQDSNDQAEAIHLMPGMQTLNGEQALALARTRHYDSDLERGKRQQEIVKAVIKRAISFNSIPKQSDVIKAVGENMTTNLSFGEMTSLISYVTAGSNLQIESLNIEGTDLWADAYYFQINDDSLANVIYQLKTHLGLTAETPGIGLNDSESAEENDEDDEDEEYGDINKKLEGYNEDIDEKTLADIQKYYDFQD